MGLMARYQRKSMEAAQRILSDQATVLDQAQSFSGPNPMLVGAGILAAVLAFFALTHILIGGLLILAAANAIRQPRNLVLTNRGLALFKSSFGGKPSTLLGTYAASDLATGAGPAQLGYVPVQLHPERVWVRSILTASLRAIVSAVNRRRRDERLVEPHRPY